jgi:prepilin-type N-terminal cleavage/methylation domain-containing protein
MSQPSPDSADHQARFGRVNPSPDRSHGFTLPEIVIALFVGTILTVVAIPVLGNALTNMRLNSAVGAISGAISKTRYRAVMNSQIYTLAITTPANTYVVTNVNTGTADAAVPLPTPRIAINGGANATYSFTLCPNGMIYGAGGACAIGSPAPPALALTSQTRQINLSISSVGNVTKTTIY